MTADQNLGSLKIKVGIDGKDATDGVSKLEGDIKRGVREFSSFSSAVRYGGMEIERNGEKLKMLGTSITNMSAINKKYGDVLKNNSVMNRLTTEEQTKLRDEYNKSALKLQAYKNQFIETAKETAALQVKTTGFSGTMYALGNKAKNVGDSLTRNVTMPLGVIGGMALKVGFDFEAAMSRVQSIAGASNAELKKMSDLALELGKKTAFSASETAGAMEALASAGFSVNEIMEATPGLLDLAAVSGGDVAASAEVAASTLRAFGLEASASGHVADIFAEAAARTNAETADMGEAMKYAAPIAHQLGMSIEETAAAIGIMSDNGIKGSQAGTTLRSALTRLAKPTDAMVGVMEDYGLSFFDAEGKMVPFGNTLEQLQDKLGNQDEKTRAAALTTLFGKEALSGMMSLVSTAPGKYDKLTKGLEDSDGAADKMARTMQDNAKNAIEQMMGSLETAGIKLAQSIAPTVREVADVVGRAADAFSDLDPEAQRMIMRLGLMAIAAGPALKIFGSVTVGAVNAAAAYKSFSAGVGASKVFAQITSGGAGASQGMNILSVGAGKVASVLAGMNPVTLGVVGALALLGGGAFLVAKSFADYQYANRWGEGINSSASTALDGVKRAQQGISDALALTAKDGSKASEDVSKAFDKLAKSVEKAGKKTSDGVKKSLKSLPQDVQEIVKASVQKYADGNKERAKQAQQLAQTIKTIESQSGQVSLDQQTYLQNTRQQMNVLAVKSLGLSAKQETQALAKLNGDVDKMTATSREKAQEEMAKMLTKTNEKFQKQSDNLRAMYEQGAISWREYGQAVQKLSEGHEQAVDPMISRLYELMKASGTSEKMMSMYFESMGLSLSDAKKAYDNLAKGANKSTGTVINATAKMTTKTRNAVEFWNALVFDPKTGEVKTNAKEVITEAMGDADSWNQLLIAAKEAPVGSNARQTFLEATFEAGKWDSLTIAEKKALVNSNIGEKLMTDKLTINDFNALPVNAKQIIVSSNAPQTIQESLMNVGQWESLPISIKDMLLSSNVPGVVNNGKISLDTWNKLSPEMKTLITNDFSSDNIKAAIKTQKDWDNLPAKVKQILANSADARKAIKDAGVDLGQYDDKKPQTKQLKVNAANAKSGASEGRDAVDKFNNKDAKTKKLKADWVGQKEVNKAKQAIDSLPDNKQTTLTITTVREEVVKKVKRATGDPYFQGGAVTVNDQPGSMYRELIVTPTGREILPSGRNVDMDLPTGSRIYNALETSQILMARRNTDRLNSLGQLDTTSAPVAATQQFNGAALNVLTDLLAGRFDQVIDALSNIGDRPVLVDEQALANSVNGTLGTQAQYARKGLA